MFDKNALIKSFKEKLSIQRYAPNTQKTYLQCLQKFLTAFDKYDLQAVKEKNIENYIHHLLEKEKISSSYQKQMLGTIGRFFELIYKKNVSFNVLSQKKGEKITQMYQSN